MAGVPGNRGGGPRHKPTALKILQGTARQDRMNSDEPKPELSSKRPPSWLTAGQRKVWKDKAPGLIDQGVLTVWDRDALGRYCVLFAQFVDLSKMSGHDVLSELRQLNVQISRLESEFGLTPASRGRIKGTPPKPEETESPIERMRRLAKGGRS